MSDYLGRLASRVLEPQRVIRPRTRSRFESFGSDLVELPSESQSFTRVTAPAARIIREERPAPYREPARTHQTVEPARELAEPHEQTHEPGTPSEVSSIAREPETIFVQSPAPAPAPVVPESPPPRVEMLVRERRTLERIERLRVRRERTDTTRTHDVMTPVEITIGRIDVRAVVSAAPPAPARRERPATMSLRDYMAGRDERRRG